MTAAATCVEGAAGRMPACTEASARIAGIARTSPMATPATAIIRPCNTTSRKIAPRPAPNAIRRPISCVRRPQALREAVRDDDGGRFAWQIDRREIAARNHSDTHRLEVPEIDRVGRYVQLRAAGQRYAIGSGRHQR